MVAICLLYAELFAVRWLLFLYLSEGRTFGYILGLP